MPENSNHSPPTHGEHDAAGHGHDHQGPTVWDKHAELPQARLFPSEMEARSWHQPLNDPVWTDAYDHMRDDDPVLGLYLNHQARALPWWIMKNHHVANLVLDDLPVLVTLCEMCSGSSAFRAEAERRRLKFRLRGMYNGTILLTEDSTRTLWSPFTGVALTGSVRGSALERLPVSQCLWSDWLAMHPTTLVLHGEPALRKGHGSEFSPGSPGIQEPFYHTLVRPLDERLPHNTLVLGVEKGTKARAYPLATLARTGPVLNDALDGTEIVVISRPGTLQALAFHRRAGERVLVFGRSDTGKIVDQETGSMWNEMGEAISGPLAGTQLVYVNSGVEEWYAFAAYHPGAEIFTAPMTAADAGIMRKAGGLTRVGKGTGEMLVPIRASGGRPPFFIVHGLLGTMPMGAAMARALGPDQPLYVLNARGFDGREPPHERVEDMIGAYVGEIRAARPSGPYMLGGMEAGGLVALQLARALWLSGEPVGPVILIDPSLAPFSRGPQNRAIDPKNPQIYSQLHQNIERSLRRDAERFDGLPYDPRDPAQLRAAIETGIATLAAFSRYVPPVFEGPTAFIISAERALAHFHPEAPWKSIVPRPGRVHVVPGNHDEFFLNHLDTVMKLVQFSLDSAVFAQRHPA